MGSTNNHHRNRNQHRHYQDHRQDHRPGGDSNRYSHKKRSADQALQHQQQQQQYQHGRPSAYDAVDEDVVVDDLIVAAQHAAATAPPSIAGAASPESSFLDAGADAVSRIIFVKNDEEISLDDEDEEEVETDGDAKDNENNNDNDNNSGDRPFLDISNETSKSSSSREDPNKTDSMVTRDPAHDSDARNEEQDESESDESNDTDNEGGRAEVLDGDDEEEEEEIGTNSECQQAPRTAHELAATTTTTIAWEQLQAEFQQQLSVALAPCHDPAESTAGAPIGASPISPRRSSSSHQQLENMGHSSPFISGGHTSTRSIMHENRSSHTPIRPWPLPLAQLGVAGRIRTHMVTDRTVIVGQPSPTATPSAKHQHQHSQHQNPHVVLQEGTLLLLPVPWMHSFNVVGDKSIDPNHSPMDSSSMVSVVPLGRIVEVFGPVSQPLYAVRLPVAPSTTASTATSVAAAAATTTAPPNTTRCKANDRHATKPQVAVATTQIGLHNHHDVRSNTSGSNHDPIERIQTGSHDKDNGSGGEDALLNKEDLSPLVLSSPALTTTTMRTTTGDTAMVLTTSQPNVSAVAIDGDQVEPGQQPVHNEDLATEDDNQSMFVIRSQVEPTESMIDTSVSAHPLNEGVTNEAMEQSRSPTMKDSQDGAQGDVTTNGMSGLNKVATSSLEGTVAEIKVEGDLMESSTDRKEQTAKPAVPARDSTPTTAFVADSASSLDGTVAEIKVEGDSMESSMDLKEQATKPAGTAPDSTPTTGFGADSASSLDGTVAEIKVEGDLMESSMDLKEQTTKPAGTARDSTPTTAFRADSGADSSSISTKIPFSSDKEDPWSADGSCTRYLRDQPGVTVYFAKHDASIVDLMEIYRNSLRGSDASNDYDEEVMHAAEMDFSDDEEERLAKKGNGAARRRPLVGHSGPQDESVPWAPLRGPFHPGRCDPRSRPAMHGSGRGRHGTRSMPPPLPKQHERGDRSFAPHGRFGFSAAPEVVAPHAPLGFHDRHHPNQHEDPYPPYYAAPGAAASHEPQPYQGESLPHPALQHQTFIYPPHAQHQYPPHAQQQCPPHAQQQFPPHTQQQVPPHTQQQVHLPPRQQQQQPFVYPQQRAYQPQPPAAYNAPVLGPLGPQPGYAPHHQFSQLPHMPPYPLPGSSQQDPEEDTIYFD